MLYQVSITKEEIQEYFEIFLLSGETKYFAMSADFVVLFRFVPIRMELISEILQTNLSMDQKTRFL